MSMKSIFFSGPSLLAFSALGVIGSLALYDRYELRTKRTKLQLALDDIDVYKLKHGKDTEQEKLQQMIKGLSYLAEYMKQASDVAGGSETEDHMDRRQVVYDFGGLKKLLNIITEPDLKQNSEVLELALKALYILLKSTSSQEIRIALGKAGGIQALVNIVISDKEYDSKVREEAAMVLRRATYFEYFKKHIKEEVPYGSSNYNFIIQHPMDKLKQLVDIMDSGNTTLEKGVVGTISHCAHNPAAATIIAKAGAVPKMIRFLSFSNKEYYVTAVFGLACIVENVNENFEADASILLTEETITSVLNILQQKEKEKCVKRVTDILCACAEYLLYKGLHEESFIKEKRELLVSLLLKHDRATMQIFGLVGSPSAEAKKKSYKLRSLVSQKAFSTRFEEMKQLIEEADKQVALDQARKKKQQQQMQMQMMMGGGGGMPGMNDIPPELLMQMLSGGGMP